jgi:hypothetical protein
MSEQRILLAFLFSAAPPDVCMVVLAAWVIPEERGVG